MGEFEAIILSSVNPPVTVRADGYLLAVHSSQESIEANGYPFIAHFPGSGSHELDGALSIYDLSEFLSFLLTHKRSSG